MISFADQFLASGRLPSSASTRSAIAWSSSPGVRRRRLRRSATGSTRYSAKVGIVASAPNKRAVLHSRSCTIPGFHTTAAGVGELHLARTTREDPRRVALPKHVGPILGPLAPCTLNAEVHHAPSHPVHGRLPDADRLAPGPSCRSPSHRSAPP